MQPIVSLILPIYKIDERVLSTALDSILNQSFTDFEMILVDDGSPDNSGQICDDYAEKDTRIRVTHKRNAGVSAARNSGLQIAKGKYVSFMDPDDELPQNALEVMVDEIESARAQIGVFAYQDVNIEGKVTGYFFQKDIEILTGTLKQEYLKFQIVRNAKKVRRFGSAAASWTAPWSKIFDRKFLEEHKICFTEGIHPAEDTLFMIKAIYFATIVVLSNSTAYKYYSGAGIMSRCSENACENNLLFLEDINKFLTKNTDFPDGDNLLDVLAMIKVLDAGQRYFFHQQNTKKWIDIKAEIRKFIDNKYIQKAIRNGNNEYYDIRYKILKKICKHHMNIVFLLFVKFNVILKRIRCTRGHIIPDEDFN